LAFWRAAGAGWAVNLNLQQRKTGQLAFTHVDMMLLCAFPTTNRRGTHVNAVTTCRLARSAARSPGQVSGHFGS
jgi:hypothetical protein